MQTKRGLRRGEAALRFREAGEKRLKSLGAKSKIAAIAARKKKLKAVKKKHKK